MFQSEHVQKSDSDQNGRRRTIRSRGIKAFIYLAVCAVIATLGFKSLFSTREPDYEGKPLSYWFDEWAPFPRSFAPPPAAFRALGAKAVPFLSTALAKQENAFSRYLHQVYLGLPEAVQRHLPLRIPAREVRWKAARALADIGPEAKAALPGLIRALHDPEPRVRAAALSAVVAVGPDINAITPVLLGCLTIPDRWFQYGLAEAVIRYDTYPPEAAQKVAEPLIEIIKSMEARSIQAIELLQRIRPIANETLLHLMEAINEQDAFIRKRKLFDHPQVQSVRSATIQALKELAGRNPRGLDFLVECIESHPRPIRAVAMEALGWVGAGARSAVPKLSACLRDPDLEVQVAAAIALFRIDRKQSRECLLILTNGMQAADSLISRRASQFLAQSQRSR